MVGHRKNSEGKVKEVSQVACSENASRDRFWDALWSRNEPGVLGKQRTEARGYANGHVRPHKPRRGTCLHSNCTCSSKSQEGGRGGEGSMVQSVSQMR